MGINATRAAILEKLHDGTREDDVVTFEQLGVEQFRPISERIITSINSQGENNEEFFFGSKIAALNFRKLFGFRKGLGNYAKNPVLI